MCVGTLMYPLFLFYYSGEVVKKKIKKKKKTSTRVFVPSERERTG